MSHPFFPYYCAQCDEPFCERVNLLNLALDYVDEAYCLNCLSADQGLDNPQALMANMLPYIYARDCFKTPWSQVDNTLCPKGTACTCNDTCSPDGAGIQP